MKNFHFLKWLFGSPQKQVYQIENDRLEKLLEELYLFLRNEGVGSNHAETVKGLIYSLQSNDLRLFRERFRSADLWGGSGSLRDIDLRDSEKQKVLSDYRNELKVLGSRV